MILNKTPHRIIVCLDGTWNSPAEETNVNRFYTNCLNNNEIDDEGYKILKKYFPGVGTEWYNRLRGGMFGYGINEQIENAYKYISTNYRDSEDQIWLIGFSRGAYAARSIVGMINNVGLLPPQNLGRFDKAYAHYRNRNADTHPKQPLSTKFFEENDCQMPSIHFLGCFDTVGSLGVPKLPWYMGGSFWYSMSLDLHEFHDTKLSSIVKHAYHVISIHDQRSWFQPTLMQLSTLEHPHNEQTLEQPWFPGMHGDVGGHNVKDSEYNNLISFRTLDWMISKADENGLHFKQDNTMRCDETDFMLNDSYKTVYQFMPQEDRVIPEGAAVDTCNAPTRCYHDRILKAITPEQIALYKSNTLNIFLEQAVSA